MPYVDADTLNATFSPKPGQLFLRDFKTQVTPNDTQKNTLIVAGIYIVVIFILWHLPYLRVIIYPFKLLTVGFHEMSHAIMGVLTCARIHSIELDPDEGGSTSMSGGISWLTLPAGYLGSSFIGACLIACGFNTNASKIASLVMAVFFLFTLWWARKSWVSWLLILGMSGLVVLFWFVGQGIALRYFILFIGVMSCMYVLWDVVDDTLARKVNTSDASEFARVCGCCPSRVWGFLWLVVAFAFFAAGVIVGLVAFKQNVEQQKADASHFLPVPGSKNAALSLSPNYLAAWTLTVSLSILGLL